MFTRDELLAGLPARRARTLLFLIESKSAQFSARSRQAMETFLTEEVAAKRDLAFLEAFSLGKQPPVRPSIQDIERYAPDWAALVPDEPRLRAAVAHVLSEKYRFARSSVPHIRAALRLDDPAVHQAYERLYHQPLHNIYATRYTPAEQFRWSIAGVSKRLESLPPFWTAFSLTLTETVGAGVLALPIAIAGIGPLGGLVILLLLGIVNMLTLAAMAESVSRSGTMRYGNAFLGAMVSDYLGNIGSVAFTLGAASLTFIMLLAYYIGFSSTLASASGIPSQIWAVLFFLVGLYFIFRESINATVASALLVGAINIALIVALALLAFTHLRTDYLFHLNLPFVNGRPFEPGILELIFGTILSAYIGHLSVGNCAKVVLRRDPTAHSLIWGGVAAQIAALLLYSIWVLAINGAIAPEVLAAQAGTALTPLAAQIGPAINVLGVIYVILAMGMASIHSSLGLFYMVSERLPSRSPAVILMPRGRGTLVLYPRQAATSAVRFGLTCLGVENQRVQECRQRAHDLGLSKLVEALGIVLNGDYPSPERGLEQNTLNKTQEQNTGTRAELTDSELADLLVSLGMARVVALKLILQYDRRAILQCAEYARGQPGLKNPAGFVVKRIRDGTEFPSPAGDGEVAGGVMISRRDTENQPGRTRRSTPATRHKPWPAAT